MFRQSAESLEKQLPRLLPFRKTERLLSANTSRKHLRYRRDKKIRKPIALVGKVYCKADATYGAISVGDLLTTSATPGHAMKADDPLRAFGAVLGKALGTLPGGTGLIPILVALQ